MSDWLPMIFNFACVGLCYVLYAGTRNCYRQFEELIKDRQKQVDAQVKKTEASIKFFKEMNETTGQKNN